MQRFGAAEQRLRTEERGRMAALFRQTWFFVLFLFCGAFLVANLIHYLLFRFSKSRDAKWGPTLEAARKYLANPARAIFFLTCVMIALPFAPALSGWWRDRIEHGLVMAEVASLGWLAAGCIYVVESIFLRKYDLKSEKGLQARKVHTQFQLLRRVAIGFVVILTIAGILWTFNNPRIWSYGTGLLASAGVASLVLAAAARSTASNFLAGAQIAFTGMIRIDDVVAVQGETARVEEISTSYVVLRIWDHRRLIVPLSFFIENPFYNLTREHSDLNATAFLYLDYTVPVDAVRAQFESIVKASEWWDGNLCKLHVTNLTDRAMEMRCAVSASDSGRAFELCCEVREKMIAWVRENYPAALPIMRISMLRQGDGVGEGVTPSR
jgi:small-conductance mechanosensitive channel